MMNFAGALGAIVRENSTDHARGLMRGWLPAYFRIGPLFLGAQLIILNTKSMIFSAKFITFNTKFIICNIGFKASKHRLPTTTPNIRVHRLISLIPVHVNPCSR